MPGLKLTLPISFTNTSLPKLRDDEILPDKGAMLLIDPTHPSNPWSGKVVTGAAIPNIAYPQAIGMMPGATAASLSATPFLGPSWAASGGKAERSAKGGIHLAPSQVNVGDGDTYAAIQTPGNGASPLNQYLTANKNNHTFFTALWGRITRPAQAYDAGTQLHSRSNGSTSVYGFYTRTAAGETQYPANATRKGHYGENVAPATSAPFYQDVAVANPTALGIGADVTLLALGNWGITSANYGKSAAMILYGFYMEDLTVSGRTYGEVSALVRAKYNRDVVVAGGRYYGDTSSG